MIEIRNTANNGFVYLLDGNWHRSNGPARVWANGEWGWYLTDRQHRYYGPQANNEWWIHGECIKYGFD